ncbi:MAG TPA: hypothetical protein PLD23_17675, partial [Armatimonadota bacterium]|nr:hypothetical protein [Armatimonadota bacterium]
MEPLTFLGDAFSEYYFTRVLWEEADLAPLLDAPGASRTHRHAMASLDRAHRALAERQQARSTHTLLVEPLSRLLEWTLGEPERVETEEGSEEAGATLLTTAGAVAARLRWLPPGAPLDRPEEGAHRR